MNRSYRLEMRKRPDRLASAAVMPTSIFQMKMITMRGIVVGAEHRAETLAGTGVNYAQKLPLIGATAIPAIEHTYTPPVGEDEGRNVDCFGAGMGGTTSGSCNIAAGIAAHGFDPDQWTSKNLSRRAINAVARPIGKGVGERTGDRAKMRDCETAFIASNSCQADAVDGGTTRAIIMVGQRGEARSARIERGKTLTCFGSFGQIRVGCGFGTRAMATSPVWYDAAARKSQCQACQDGDFAHGGGMPEQG